MLQGNWKRLFPDLNYLCTYNIIYKIWRKQQQQQQLQNIPGTDGYGWLTNVWWWFYCWYIPTVLNLYGSRVTGQFSIATIRFFFSNAFLLIFSFSSKCSIFWVEVAWIMLTVLSYWHINSWFRKTAEKHHVQEYQKKSHQYCNYFGYHTPPNYSNYFIIILNRKIIVIIIRRY